jgi:hypothetical protein
MHPVSPPPPPPSPHTGPPPTQPPRLEGPSSEAAGTQSFVAATVGPRPASFSDLSFDAIAAIVSHMDIGDVGRLDRVSRLFHSPPEGLSSSAIEAGLVARALESGLFGPNARITLPASQAIRCPCSDDGRPILLCAEDSLAQSLAFLLRSEPIVLHSRTMGACDHHSAVIDKEHMVRTCGSESPYCRPNQGSVLGQGPHVLHSPSFSATVDIRESASPFLKLEVAVVAAGPYHTLALTWYGQLYTWGHGADGRLGLGSTYDRARPTHVDHSPWGDDHIAVSVAAGGMHSLVLSASGHVYSCGDNTGGQLGQGRIAQSLSFCRVSALIGADVVIISAGHTSSACLTRTGDPIIWGCGSSGQLGTLDPNEAWTTADRGIYIQRLPFAMYFPAGISITHIACGCSHTALVDHRGHAYTCGYGSYGELGLGELLDVHLPQRVELPEDTRIVTVAVGSSHTLFLTSNRKVLSCGRGAAGSLGHPDFLNRYEPMLIVALMKERICEITAGGSTSMARTADGFVYTFGDNIENALGRFAYFGPSPDTDHRPARDIAIHYFGIPGLASMHVWSGHDIGVEPVRLTTIADDGLAGPRGEDVD